MHKLFDRSQNQLPTNANTRELIICFGYCLVMELEFASTILASCKAVGIRSMNTSLLPPVSSFADSASSLLMVYFLDCEGPHPTFLRKVSGRFFSFLEFACILMPFFPLIFDYSIGYRI